MSIQTTQHRSAPYLRRTGAQSIDAFVLAFSDPALHAPKPQRTRVNASISFEILDDDHIRTLSTNTVSDGGDVEGLLYVPDLDPSDPCVNASDLYIPSNATRKGNLPSEQYLYVAFAPWISAPCVKSYLAASGGARAFLTYLPDFGIGTPPLANNETWDLHDGGQWKSQNKFPVYALPGSEGQALMQQMGQFSGVSSNLKIEGILAQEQFDPADYVRLYTTFGTSQSSNLPTLWAFLLIALGLVLLLVGTVSLLMHWVQRQGRRDLRRRVDNGEVDLEILGIKRSRIPQEAIDLLETSIYTQHRESSNKEYIPADQTSNISAEQPTPSSSPGNQSRYSQTMCPICLDDFVTNITTVRSLPCHHIYHPSCIDPFLRDNSSLCPLCKDRVLPSNSKDNVSEAITNSMVRHERRVRRMRRERQVGELPDRPAAGEQGVNGWWIANFRHGYNVGRRAFSAPGGPAATPTISQIEMGVLEGRAVSGPQAAEAFVRIGETLRPPPAEDNHRMEWMRRRFNTLRGIERTMDEDEAERSARLPRCESTMHLATARVVDIVSVCLGRRAIGVVFPGFR